jgi:hypothetical protein
MPSEDKKCWQMSLIAVFKWLALELTFAAKPRWKLLRREPWEADFFISICLADKSFPPDNSRLSSWRLRPSHIP